jgi:hypothetical protein
VTKKHYIKRVTFGPLVCIVVIDHNNENVHPLLNKYCNKRRLDMA